MNYGKKKGIIIAIVIIILLVLLAIGGLFVYLTTDIFKSDETLFFKYISEQYKTMPKVNDSSNNQLNQMLGKKETSPYETNATISFGYSDNTENSQTINNELQKATINILTRQDKLNNKLYSNLKINYDNSNLVDIHYANSNDIFALKWEEVVQTYYVGIRNDNLKAFAQKLKIEDTTAIPNKIQNIDYLQLLNVTDEEKAHIKEICFNALLGTIPADKYTKQHGMIISKDSVNYETTAYRLDLTSEEVKNAIIKLLETLRDDSIALNLFTTKAKMLGLDNEYTTIEGMRQKLQEQINATNQVVVDDSKGLSIVVYVYNGETIQTEIIAKNEIKLTITSSSQDTNKSVKLVIENLSQEQDYNTVIIDVTNQTTDLSKIVNVNVNIDNEQTYTMSITNTVISSGIQTEISLSIGNEDNVNFDIIYEAQTIYDNLTQDIEELVNDNTVVLNDYGTEELNNLMQAIIQRVGVVASEKVQTLVTLQGIIQNNISTPKPDNSMQEMEKDAFNSRFQAYLGDSLSSAITKSLCDLVNSNNLSSEHIIAVNGVSDVTGIESLKNLITVNSLYSITATYDEEGYINSITISQN